MISVLVLAWATVDAQIPGGATGRGRIKGTVTGPDGKPLEGVVVRFTSEELKATFDITTDKKGEWTVNGIAGGNWAIDFLKEGYVPRGITYPIQQLSFNKPIELSLEKAQAAPTSPSVNVGGQEAAPEDPALPFIVEGSKLADSGEYAAAIAKYEEALKLNPALHGIYGEIGNMYTRLGESDKAVEFYKKLIEKDPSNVDARLAAAGVLLDQKKTQEADQILEGLNLDEVTNPNILFNLGAKHYNAQQTQSAIKYWEKAVQLDPKMTEAYVQLGAAYVSLKENDKAKQMFMKVIELAPGSEDAKAAQELLDSIQ
jgi:tetratricopeptide (TPR) repeat protein